MVRHAHRGDAETEQQRIPASRIDGVSWDDLRIFLICAQASSFREAARQLAVASSTVVRRVERLELSLAVTLFDRVPEGVTLTEAGRGIAASAKGMENALIELQRRSQVDKHAKRGRVTVAVTEGLGSFWVMPRLVDFQRANPDTTIDLYCGMESVDVLRLEADMSIQFSRPTSADIIAVRLGKLHLYPFASPEYLEIYGTPKSYEDVQHHRFVQQITPELDSSAFAAYFRLADPGNAIAVRTNTSTAHLYAIEKGAGIGGLPTFAAMLGAPVVPVDIGSGYSLDIWLSIHPGTRSSRHKALVVDTIKSMFDPAVYPWFDDVFIHPLQFMEDEKKSAAINSGTGFLAADPCNFKLATKRVART
jgi:DNA-binding transcriptional LysR family regulator